jgi:hypothetical protein
MIKLMHLSLISSLLVCAAQTPKEEIIKEIADTTNVEYTEALVYLLS